MAGVVCFEVSRSVRAKMEEVAPGTLPDPVLVETAVDAVVAALEEVFPRIVASALPAVRPSVVAEALPSANFGPVSVPPGDDRGEDEAVATVLGLAATGKAVSRTDVLEVTASDQGLNVDGEPANGRTGFMTGVLRGSGEPVRLFAAGPARPGYENLGEAAATGATIGDSWAEGPEALGGEDEAQPDIDADADQPKPSPGETRKSGESDGGDLEEPTESGLSELSRLVDEVAAVRGGAGGALTASDCLVLLEALTRALYPRRWESFLPGGVRAAETVDDLTAGDPWRRLAPGATWRRITSWGALADAVARAGTRATGLVLWQRRSGPGHAFAVHHVAGAGPRWIELQAPAGRRVSAKEPVRAAAGARVVIVDADGQVVAWHDLDPVLPPKAESAVPALALSDPPTSLEYGALGVELEFPLLLVKIVNIGQIPPSMVPAWSDVLFSNRYVKGVVEQITPDGNLFVEIVSQPVAEIPGDDGYADRPGYFKTVRALERLFAGPAEFSLRPLEDLEFTISAKGRHVVLAPPIDPWLLIAAQYTIGLPIGALYELYRWARQNSPDAARQDLRDIDAGLSFAERVANLFAVEAGSRVNADIPLIAGELFYQEDGYAVAGFAVSVFTHAMAALRMEAARRSTPMGQAPPVRNAKEFLPVASRHAASVTRQALSPEVRRFLDDNAARLAELFTRFAAEFGPQFIDNPLEVAISDPGADLSRLPDPESTVQGYLADAFLNETREPRVLPPAFGVHTSFGELDYGVGGRRRRGLVLSEVRQMRTAKSRADSEAQYVQVADIARTLVGADEDRHHRAQELRQLGASATASRLARHPVVRDAEELFHGTGLLDSLPGDLLNGLRIGLDRTLVLDAIRELARADGRASAPGAPVITDPGGRMAAEMRRVIARLEATGREVLDGLALYPTSSQHSSALAAWAAMTRVAPRLLAAADPHVGSEIPGETSVTRWHRVSEVRGSFGKKPRSDDLKRLDRSVARLLADRQDPARLERVLLDIRAWRLSKEDPASSSRATAVGNLERRVVYELGALWGHPLPATPAAPAESDGGRPRPSSPPRLANSSVWAFPADTSASMESGMSAAIGDSLNDLDLGRALRLSAAYRGQAADLPAASTTAQDKLAQWAPSPEARIAVLAEAGLPGAQPDPGAPVVPPLPAKEVLRAANVGPEAVPGETGPVAGDGRTAAPAGPVTGAMLRLSVTTVGNAEPRLLEGLWTSAAPDVGVLARDLEVAFREFLGVPSGKLPGHFRVRVDLPVHLGGGTMAVVQAASVAAKELGPVRLRLPGATVWMNLCG